MFTLVLLLEDKGSHQYVLPPIGPQDIECGVGRGDGGLRRREDTSRHRRGRHVGASVTDKPLN